jgi:hypothetical protein
MEEGWSYPNNSGVKANLEESLGVELCHRLAENGERNEFSHDMRANSLLLLFWRIYQRGIFHILYGVIVKFDHV